MKKIITIVTLSVFISTSFALIPVNNLIEQDKKQWSYLDKLVKKQTPELKKFQEILDKYFIKKPKDYYSQTFGKYVPNIKYNGIVQKEIEILIKKDFKNNPEYYKSFGNSYSYTKDVSDDLERIIASIPKVQDDSVSSLIFNDRYITDSLIKSSFNVNYNGSSYDSFLNAIKNRIEGFKNRNWYYPSLEELKNESIYYDRKKVKIKDVINNIEYKVITKPTKVKSLTGRI